MCLNNQFETGNDHFIVTIKFHTVFKIRRIGHANVFKMNEYNKTFLICYNILCSLSCPTDILVLAYLYLI